MSPNLKIPVPGTWAADLATNSVLIHQSNMESGCLLILYTHDELHVQRWCIYTTYQTVINWFLYTNILSSPESRIFNYPCFWLYRMVLPGCYRVKILFPHIFHYFNKKYSRTRALDQLKVFKRFTTKSMHVLH